VSCETSFNPKPPKHEPKLVSALSETKFLFWLFRFLTETASFGVLIEPKQKKSQTETDSKWPVFYFVWWTSILYCMSSMN